jgi:uncharacterized protein (TIGR02266 family)
MLIKDPKNILVAGDSVFIGTSLSHILDGIGHSVWIASDVGEVTSKVEEASGEIDLLILDMQKLNINGKEVLRWIKDSEYAGKFSILAIISTDNISQNINHLKELGVAGVITKSFSPEQIVFRVNRLLFTDKLSDRVAPRAPVSIPVDYSVGNETHTSVILNISATGLFLYTNEDLLPGTMLHFKFILPGTERKLDLKGIVRWSTKPGSGEDYFNGSGVSFTAISYKDSEIIGKFVQEEIKKIDPEILLPY